DIESGKCLHTLLGHSSKVYAVKLSQDGRIAVSVSKDNTLKVWNLATGECIATFSGDFFIFPYGIASDHKTILVLDEFTQMNFLRLIE
ncbi:MAG: hypothetical protein HUU50_06285, partial [Candidatus Brocadiae bacterium]|nr:hypothetical protein [Candidatus Brocadiia bacterium]